MEDYRYGPYHQRERAHHDCGCNDHRRSYYSDSMHEFHHGRMEHHHDPRMRRHDRYDD